MSNGYLVISADCHAGPELAGVPRVPRPAVPGPVRRGARRRATHSCSRCGASASAPTTTSSPASEEFQEEWFGEDEEGNSLHEVGLRGGWDAKKRDEELDGRRRDRRGRVPRARRGHRQDGRARSAPASTIDVHRRPRARARRCACRTTAGRPSCASESPQRRAGLIVAPILGDLDGAIAEITPRARRGARGAA